MQRHVAIVGAGPAGLNAAIEAHKRGARVTLIDEAVLPGGQIYRQSMVSPDAQGIGLNSELARKKKLLDGFNKIKGHIDYRSSHTAYALFNGPELHISNHRVSEVLHPDAVIVATGVSERGIPFPGWTTPGVVYAGAVQAMLKSQGTLIGERILVAGAGPLPVAVAAQLATAGAKVQAVALLHPFRDTLLHPYALWSGRSVINEGFQYLSTLKRARVKILPRYFPKRIYGDENVEGVQLAQHDGTGKPVPGTEQRIDCDVLAINYGFTVNNELPCMAGAKTEYVPERGGWTPITDGFCRTNVTGLYVAGDGARLRGAWVAGVEGKIAGAVAALDHDDNKLLEIRREMAPSFRIRRQHQNFQHIVKRLLRLPAGVWQWAEDDTTVCRCECIPHSRLVQAIADGHLSLNAIKKNTRAGMGWCGGRMCLQNVAAISNDGHPPLDLAPMTPRPVARPVSLGSVQNQAQAAIHRPPSTA